ncbi:hypothetical protein C0995_013986 [Termitomyces sp. Mi166|nr:hypothetical protein C0995_013986 [Termitomyces sp. Mi166\
MDFTTVRSARLLSPENRTSAGILQSNTSSNEIASVPTSTSSSPTEHDEDQYFANFMSHLTSPTADVQATQGSSGQFGASVCTIGGMDEPSTTRFFSSSRKSSYQRREGLEEEPIYTRQQANDMLDAVSNCFAKQEKIYKVINMDEDIKSADPVNTCVVVSDDQQDLQQLLSNSLPRLVNDLQNFLDEDGG